MNRKTYRYRSGPANEFTSCLDRRSKQGMHETGEKDDQKVLKGK